MVIPWIPTAKDWERLEIELGMDPEVAEEFGWRGTNQGSYDKTVALSVRCIKVE
jgi:hypothetical protein